MRNLSSWLIVMFMGMFWVFRLIIALTVQFGGTDFGGFIAFDFNKEVVILFITIVCIVLFVKRSIIGTGAYMITYLYYFGGYIFNNLIINRTEEALSMSTIQNLLAAALGLILAIIALVDLLFDKATRRSHSDRKTDWFFKNKNFDRKYDERADKNQYRNY